MSEATDTTATTPTDEPKGEMPVTDPHAHETAAEVHADTVPEAEASIEKVTEPDPEHASEPTPAPPPELAEPVETELSAGSEELVPVQEPGSEELVPVHDVVIAPVESPAGELTQEEAKPKRTRTTKSKAAPAVATPSADTEPAEPTGAVATVEAPVAAKPETKKKWYAIKVQSGREDTIKAAILRKVAIEGLEEYFGQIMIPFEEEVIKKTVRVKDKKTGDYTTQEKKVTRKKKKFQGYLFAELEFNDRILYLFRETSGVGDFLNLRGTPPVPEPMPEHEVQSMLTGVKHGDPLKKGKVIKVDFEKGDRVRILGGTFEKSEGEVKFITEPKDPTDTPKVTVVVTLWGRPVDVELDYWQVEKV